MPSRYLLPIFIAASIMGSSVHLQAQGDNNATASDTTPHLPERWLVCQTDDQCALASHYCGAVAINKKYLAEFHSPPACQQITPNLADAQIAGKGTILTL